MWQAAVQRIASEFGGTLSFAAEWAVSAALLIGAAVAAWLLHAAILALVRRLLRQRRPFLRSVLGATKGPTRLGLLLLALAIALPTAPLGPDIKGILARCLGLAFICLLGWIAVTALHIAADIYLRRFRLDVEDNLQARTQVTQVRVLLHVLDAVIVLVTVGFALMTFDAVRQFGVTLFASAGVAGIIGGFAARPVLANFLAGVQIAVAQPIRIDDAVIVENEWGNVEDITFSYVIVKLWDLRRMIVPLSYFIEKPFQNWTRTGGELIGTVFLYVDHTAPVEAIRKKLMEIASQSKLWNGQVVNLQVSDCKETTIELRALVSANNASAVWDLRCEVREKLIDFLQREHPSALPRRRYEAAEKTALQSDEAREVRTSRRR
ncbi:MAG: mechanosensitive ion channel domain-containing protein [Xanthobacteraceae bacterium]|jgi:small-conductance mechanosensitive channel